MAKDNFEKVLDVVRTLMAWRRDAEVAALAEEDEAASG